MLTGYENKSDIPFVPALLSMKRKDKLRVIHILTESMLTPSSEKEDDYTSKMLDKHFGCWAGEESVDDIVASIKSSSAIREPLSM